MVKNDHSQKKKKKKKKPHPDMDVPLSLEASSKMKQQAATPPPPPPKEEEVLDVTDNTRLGSDIEEAITTTVTMAPVIRDQVDHTQRAACMRCIVIFLNTLFIVSTFVGCYGIELTFWWTPGAVIGILVSLGAIYGAWTFKKVFILIAIIYHLIAVIMVVFYAIESDSVEASFGFLASVPILYVLAHMGLIHDIN